MSSSGFAQFIPLILIFVIFYFFLIRPQQKRVKEHKDMVKNLKRGDEVITSGGIIGTVDRVFEDDRIELQISDGVKVQVIRNTIQSHLSKNRQRSKGHKKKAKTKRKSNRLKRYVKKISKWNYSKYKSKEYC